MSYDTGRVDLNGIVVLVVSPGRSHGKIRDGVDPSFFLWVEPTPVIRPPGPHSVGPDLRRRSEIHPVDGRVWGENPVSVLFIPSPVLSFPPPNRIDLSPRPPVTVRSRAFGLSVVVEVGLESVGTRDFLPHLSCKFLYLCIRDPWCLSAVFGPLRPYVDPG